jgi:hypothetical protein
MGSSSPSSSSSFAIASNFFLSFDSFLRAHFSSFFFLRADSEESEEGEGEGGGIISRGSDDICLRFFDFFFRAIKDSK